MWFSSLERPRKGKEHSMAKRICICFNFEDDKNYHDLLQR